MALDLVLIPRFGINGAAMASSAAYFANAALLLTALKRELGVDWAMLLVPTGAELRQYHQALRNLLAKLGVENNPVDAT